ncbi:MAG: N-acetyltransferase [Atopobiaceae bacterium]|nr:N-acetyltransferase [Atopobiaceae bacterium]
MADFVIRKGQMEDLDTLMEIYAHAREFMAEHGNESQWGPTQWPPRNLIAQDIEQGTCHVAEYDGRIAATFFYDAGEDCEPCYRVIEDGSWADDTAYGVVHRIASAHIVGGAGQACLTWALEQTPHLRIDTHKDNIPLQTLLKKLGFSHRGTIYVYEDEQPRMAFEHVAAS